MEVFKLGRDVNGNKIIKVKVGTARAFNIQTNGNLPKTHQALDDDDINYAQTQNEVHAYIKQYGTKRQKEILGW